MPAALDINVLGAVAASPPQRKLPPASLRLRQQALGLAEAEGLGRASYSFRIVPLESPAGDVLCADGEQLAAPWLIPEQGELTAVACGVATLGGALEARVSRLFAEQRRALAVALDGLGNELLFAASRRLQDRMLAEVRRLGLTMAGELRAGDPGLALDAQRVVLRLADAAAAGVTLVRGGMMVPVKSTSVVFGVGLALPQTRWSRCDNCRSRPKCALIGEKAAGAALSAVQ